MTLKPRNINRAGSIMSDDLWRNVVTLLPTSTKLDLEDARYYCGVFMWLYATDYPNIDAYRKTLHPDLRHLARRPYPANHRVIPVGNDFATFDWPDDEVADDHERLAKASREFIAAFDPGLTADPAKNYDELLDQVSATAKHAESQTKKFRDRAIKARKIGRRADDRRALFIEGLIGVWKLAGGQVSGGTSNGKGGPLVRFIAAIAGGAMSSAPTLEMIRHWIRDYKKGRQIVVRGE